jgi:hypothetical protein
MSRHRRHSLLGDAVEALTHYLIQLNSEAMEASLIFLLQTNGRKEGNMLRRGEQIA